MFNLKQWIKKNLTCSHSILKVNPFSWTHEELFYCISCEKKLHGWNVGDNYKFHSKDKTWRKEK